MKLLIASMLWLLLLVVCWPVAVLALMAWPVLWLLTLPFRLVGLVIEGLFRTLRGLLLLPARLLGEKC